MLAKILSITLFFCCGLVAAQNPKNDFGQFVDIENYQAPSTHPCNQDNSLTFLRSERKFFTAVTTKIAENRSEQSCSSLVNYAVWRLSCATEIANKDRQTTEQKHFKYFWKQKKSIERYCIEQYPTCCGPLLAQCNADCTILLLSCKRQQQSVKNKDV